MGKISDIWVRLGLKKNEFDKGMDDAVKKTKKADNSMKSILSSIKGGWLAVAGVIASVGAAMTQLPNKVGDAFNNTFAGIKSGWRSILADMSNYKPDFSSVGNFFKGEASWIKRTFGNAKDAAEAGREMSAAFDAEFELLNSVQLQKSMISDELNELQVMMRDTTLSLSDRKAAAERYKALLQPLADAEIRIYGSMMEAAAKEWQAGAGLSRQYSAQELTDFFALYGTDADKATALFPELQRVYESRKGDVANQPIFDTAKKLADAQAEMSRVDKEISRTYLSIKKTMEDMFNIGSDTSEIYLKKTLKEIKDEIATDTREINEDLADIGDIDLEIDLTDVDNDINAFLEKWKQGVEEFAMLNGMLEQSIVSAMGNGLQALTDLMFGLEGADASQVLAGILSPFADTMTQLGEMLIAEGIAISAFKKALSELDPAIAIGAGVALLAVGAALKSGIQKLGANAGGGGATQSYSGGGSYGSTDLNYESTLTVEVVGRISGSDIVLAGSKTQNKWNR